MNTKRIFTWGAFIVVIILIIWGLIAASNKAKQEDASIATVDEVTSTDWISSTSTVPVTVIEYSDFQCPACAAYFPMVERLLIENPEKVRLVYRHFPLSQHANAVPASKAAEAAGRQGKFWEMYRELFIYQDTWELSTDARTIFDSYAKNLGLDMEKYATDYDSEEVNQKINNDLKSALKAGVNSTPSFFINGKKIQSPQTYDEFKTIIEQAATDNS